MKNCWLHFQPAVTGSLGYWDKKVSTDFTHYEDAFYFFDHANKWYNNAWPVKFLDILKIQMQMKMYKNVCRTLKIYCFNLCKGTPPPPSSQFANTYFHQIFKKNWWSVKTPEELIYYLFIWSVFHCFCT